MNRFFTFLLSLLVGFAAQASEGFWLPQQLSSSKLLPQLTSDHIQALTSPVFRLGDCSAVLVSADGLLLTSASCIRPYLAAQLSTGFAAEQLSDEIQLTGLTAYQGREQQDLTVAINRQLNDTTTAIQRSLRQSELQQELLSRCAAQGRHCQLYSQHYGLQFTLQYYQPYADVRLVYLPAMAVTNSTNTGWPRYDADFVLLRLYQHDKPIRNKQFARLAPQGVAEQQQILVADFVAQSKRYSAAEEVRFMFEQWLPQAQSVLKRTLAVLQQFSAQDTATTTLTTALQQQHSKLQRMFSEYQQGQLISRRQQQQQQVKQWITASAVRQQLYGSVLQHFHQLLQQQQQMALRDLVLDNLQYARLPALAVQLYQHALLSAGRSDVESAAIEQQLRQLDSAFDARVDLELALHFLALYAELPAPLRLTALDQYFALSDGFSREIVRHKLAAIYRQTELSRSDVRQAWRSAMPLSFEQSDDPLINFAVAMQQTSEQLAQQRTQLTVQLAQARAALMEVIIAFNDASGQLTYAEANGSLRLSVGKVTGYQPTDAVWYMPFSRPQHLASADSQNNLVANFLSDADSCGDIAGAPTFNLDAAVVGIMYAGTGQRTLADWHHETQRGRAVHVDSRFIIWHLQQSAAGRRVLQQITLAD